MGETSNNKNRSSEFIAWCNMRYRCQKPDHPQYPNYGGRGIRVCERWLSFKNFMDDMGFKPSNGHSLDRIDVNGHYEPGNCRWATVTQQNRNQRARHYNKSGQIGVHWDKSKRKWRAEIRVNGKTKHIGYSDNLQDAVKIRKAAEKKYWGEQESKVPV